MDIAGPKCRIAEVLASKKTRHYRRDILTLVGQVPALMKAGGVTVSEL